MFTPGAAINLASSYVALSDPIDIESECTLPNRPASILNENPESFFKNPGCHPNLKSKGINPAPPRQNPTPSRNLNKLFSSQ